METVSVETVVRSERGCRKERERERKEEAI